MQKGCCRICKSPATGMHFGAFTCRACGAFFRRATVLKLQYRCKTGAEDCNVDGRGRFVCRFCRYAKCMKEGMNPNCVQLDYDPMQSIRADSYSDEDSPNSSRKTSEEDRKYPVFYESFRDLECTFGTPPAEDIPVVDLSDLSAYISSIFRVKNEPQRGSELERLTEALSIVLKGQKGAEELKLLEEINVMDTVGRIAMKIKALSRWFVASTLFSNLEVKTKMEILKRSWKLLTLFERIATTSRIYKDVMVSEKIMIVSSDSFINVETIQIDFSPITQCTNNYIKNMLMPFASRLVRDVGKHLVALQLTDTEIAFCMGHLLRPFCYSMDKESMEFCDQIEEELANNLHSYYTRIDLPQYSHRLLCIMNCIRLTQRIHADGNKILELFRLFDVFSLKIDEPSFFIV